MTMCPPSQFMRMGNDVLVHEGAISAFEFDPFTNKFDENLAISKYVRSEADKNYAPEDLRPLPVLVKTMDHIINYVIRKRLNSQEEGTSYLDLYQFLRDRFRAIESDITIQNLSGIDVIDILQKITLFFIWGGIMFAEYPEDKFSFYQNQQILVQTFSMLKEQYKIFRMENNGMMACYECDFIAMNLLLFLPNDDFMSGLMLLDNGVLNSEPIQNVLEIRKAILNSDFEKAVKIINESELYFGMIALENLRDFWSLCILELKTSLRRDFPKGLIQNYFDLSDENLTKFMESFNIKFSNSEVSNLIVNFDLKQPIDCSKLPNIFITKKFKERFDQINLADFICSKESKGSIQKTVISPLMQAKIETPKQNIVNLNNKKIEVKKEIDWIPKKKLEDEKKEINFTIKKEDSCSTIEGKKKINFTQGKNIEIKEEIPITDSYITQDKIHIEKKKNNYFRCKPLPLSLPLKIISMIPQNLPKLSYSSLLIKSSDFSESSNFVNKQLEIDDKQNVIFSQQFTLSGTTILVSIFHQITEMSNNIRCVLNCEDTNSNGDFNFNISEYNSPHLGFDSILRRSFVSSISEFYSCDLTNVIKMTISRCFQILESPKWVNSSANSVLIFINKIIKEIVVNLKSNEFISKIVPFIHGIFSRNDLLNFINIVENLELPLIYKEESIEPIENSSWPIYIRDNLSISMYPFLIPIDIEFVQEKFVDKIIKKFENELPIDYVNLSYLDNNFELILNSFDVDL